jgi:hypothetical protein
VHLTLSLSFVINFFILLILACAIGYRSCIEVVVALVSLSNTHLLILWLEIGRQLWLGIIIGHGRGSSGQKSMWRP